MGITVGPGAASSHTHTSLSFTLDSWTILSIFGQLTFNQRQPLFFLLIMEVSRSKPKQWYHKFLAGDIFQICSKRKLRKYEIHASQISLPESVAETPRKQSTISFGYTALIDTLKGNLNVSRNFEKDVIDDVEQMNSRKTSSSDGDSAVSSMSEGSGQNQKKIEL